MIPDLLTDAELEAMLRNARDLPRAEIQILMAEAARRRREREKGARR